MQRWNTAFDVMTQIASGDGLDDSVDTEIDLQSRPKCTRSESASCVSARAVSHIDFRDFSVLLNKAQCHLRLSLLARAL